jgi:hypothetical protein
MQRRAPVLLRFGFAAMAAGAASCVLSRREQLRVRVLVLTAIAALAVVLGVALLRRR